MLPLALRDLVSLCNTPFVTNSHGNDFMSKNFWQSIGRVEKNALQRMGCCHGRALLCQCRHGLYRLSVVINTVLQETQEEVLCNGGFFSRHRRKSRRLNALFTTASMSASQPAQPLISATRFKTLIIFRVNISLSSKS